MSKKNKEYLAKVRELYGISVTEAAKGSFAYQLQSNSLRAHLNELELIEAEEERREVDARRDNQGTARHP